MDWIARGLDKPGKTKGGLAEALGRSPSAVTALLKGERSLKADEIPIIKEYLGLHGIPIVGFVGAGGEVAYDTPLNGEDVVEADDAPPDAVAVEIRGDSLGAGFDRWYAIYRDRRDAITDDLLGQLCVVGTDDGRTLVKWVRRGGRRFTLLSGTGSVEENVGIEWVAEVIDLKPSRRLRPIR